MAVGVTLPKISLAWWDVNKKKIAYAIIPERKLTIALGESVNSFTPPAPVQNKLASTQQNAGTGIAPKIDIPATQVIEQDNRLFYAVIAGLVAILLFVIFWVISLQKKVTRLAEVRTDEQSDETLKKKVLKPTATINKQGLDTIKTASELQKYIQNYALEHWDAPKNTPLEEIFQRVKQHSPELKDDIDQVVNPLVAALYAGKEVDLSNVKKHCAIIIQTLQKKQKSTKDEAQILPELNPS
ncbi:MAG: hypothetical protein methR_P1202 [Methyloprofundus sp.]|nr:MAG: hypothetical protein methR_P1202 [Methyloprofundus sp.]